MSLLIKGMDMPKRGCDHCFLRAGNYCSRLAENESVIKYAVKEERHPNCPIVEVEEVKVIAGYGSPRKREITVLCVPNTTTVIEAED